MENLGHLIFFLTLSIIDCNGQKGVPSASIKDQNNGPAFQDNDNVNIFSMAIRVVEVSNGGTKLERFLPKNQHI